MKKIIINRKNLYERIWEEPISKVCTKYYVTGNELKNICKELNIPIPDRKYWAERRAGKKVEKEKLPKNKEEKYTIEVDWWKVERRKEKQLDSLAGYEKTEKEKIREVCKKLKVESYIPNLHLLVKYREKNKDTNQNGMNYDVPETDEIEKRKDSIYHTIFTTIEELGYRVEAENESFVVCIGEERIPFKIREKAKIEYRDIKEGDENVIYYQYINGKKKIKEIKGSGILELKIDFYGKKNTWVDTNKTKLEQVIGDIIIEFFYCATKSKNLKIEREQERRKYEEKEKEEYREKILFRPNEVKELFQIGKKISKIELGMTGSNMRTMILEDIIEKMVLHLGAFSKLVYHSEIKELDISILATIARNIMECSNTYFYYAERKITEEEVSFRYHIANLHYDNSMYDIVQKLGFSQNNARTDMLLFGKKIIRDSIKNSSIYKTLTKEEKSQVLNGNQAYMKKRQKVEHKLLEKNIESAIYNIFSNSTHAYYIGLGNNSMNGSIAHIGYITPEMLLSFSTEICILYASNVLVDYLNLRKKYNQYLEDFEKKHLKELQGKDKLLEWLAYQNKDYGNSFFDMTWDSLDEEEI